jgi:mRNA interferase ChpB
MGVIRCDQPRTIDMAARNGMRLERIPDSVVNEVLARLDAILS